MINRVALLIASLAAVGVLVVGLTLAGFPPRGAGTTVVAVTPSAAVAADPTPQVQIDPIYVAPPKPPGTVVVHRTVGASGGEHETDSDGGGD
ncbi:MAG: hypothetical protein ACHQ3P_11650 [Candidatus Limnocylindrales bacterium]